MEQDRIRNFSIVAHIDHGKSTLADRDLELTETVTGREMREQLLDSMELERERGITIKAQAVRVPWKGHQLNLIDTPGHVDFTYEVSRSLQACEGALLLVDAAQGVEAQTLANAFLALENDLEIVPVVNKIDLPQADPAGASVELAELLGGERDAVLQISAKTGEGVESVLDAIVERIPPPAGDSAAAPRALIFDSSYDQYRGVVAFVRVVDGAFRRGDRLQAMAQGTRFEAEELGFFSPTMQPAETLEAGEVGYVITGLKDVSRLRVGDTITAQEKEASEPLPGYKDVKPMVFAGLFPTDSDDYPELRDALERLKLSDASLVYEPETSHALGFGFRCGFLGLLHMEIVRERLEREFDLDLLVTAPNVAYRVKPPTGDWREVHTPTDMPNELEEVEEPYIKASIIVPKEYVGAVMELNNDRRGRFDHLEYLSDARLCELRLRRDRLPAGDARARRRARRRRAGRRALADHPSRRRLRPRSRARGAAAAGDPSPDVRRRAPGGDRLARDRAGDSEGEAQGRAREVLRRRHHAQAEVARAAEGGEAPDEAGRHGRGTAGGVPRSPQPERGSQVSGPRHLYVHLPFCSSRCGYCDFVTAVGRPDEHATYVEALLEELELERDLLARELETVFLGGGTPTFTEPGALERLLDSLPPAAELTVEANPETVTPELAALLRRAGVNRVSLGAQSFQPELLAVLDHRVAQPDT